ncbi:acetylornithine transaminase, partial [Corynebacterium bovis]
MDTYGTPAVELVSGRGARVTDSDGRVGVPQRIDGDPGEEVDVLPAVVDAVSRQVATLG